MLTKEYWQARDAGELPDRCVTWAAKVARDECCDWKVGTCIRNGNDCLLKTGRRCKWFEEIVLAPKDQEKNAAKLKIALAKKSSEKT